MAALFLCSCSFIYKKIYLNNIQYFMCLKECVDRKAAMLKSNRDPCHKAKKK